MIGLQDVIGKADKNSEMLYELREELEQLALEKMESKQTHEQPQEPRTIEIKQEKRARESSVADLAKKNINNQLYKRPYDLDYFRLGQAQTIRSLCSTTLFDARSGIPPFFRKLLRRGKPQSL